MGKIQQIKHLFLLFIFTAFSLPIVVAQTDTLSYVNGEITVDWDQVSIIKSGQSYLIAMSNGGIFDGTINSIAALNGVEIIRDEGSVKANIVDFKPIEDQESSRLLC